MTDEHTNFEAAFDIYTTMQRHGVEPDNLLYGHLIAIAGRCRKLEVGRREDWQMEPAAAAVNCNWHAYKHCMQLWTSHHVPARLLRSCCCTNHTAIDCRLRLTCLRRCAPAG